MKRIYIVLFSFVVVFGALFGAVEYLDISFLKDPQFLLQSSGIYAAVISVLFLASDILLPVPGSVIMIGNGALFGVAVGALLSLLGCLLSSMMGYLLGYKWGNRIADFMNSGEKENHILKKYGKFAIIITRPIPLLSESIAIMAGVQQQITFYQMFFYSLLGFLPSVLIYAFVGVQAVDVAMASFSFLLVLGITGVFWTIGMFVSQKIEK
jgi:uncharacterized membrane protein YdjX (TVP38/TMEM64 family)